MRSIIGPAARLDAGMLGPTPLKAVTAVNAPYLPLVSTACDAIIPSRVYRFVDRQFFDQYWDVYYRLSPRVVEAMNSDPEIKELVRWSMVAPLVRYYELVLAFPDTSPETVAEPWRSFLFKVRDEMEGWASVIELPRTLGKADLISAAREIGVAMRAAESEAP